MKGGQFSTGQTDSKMKINEMHGGQFQNECIHIQNENKKINKKCKEVKGRRSVQRDQGKEI